ncbi:hypothetical protein CKAH01_18141 [Colletotrichum kahawae]|uniref:F-box domain-containing protein n=1 Tax=Colletotrichum kahawae TaxID=34407 RepID=A0AAD9Y9H5_COLKA|nr:hypothetical protein CKAH01_18141 [Colletotrichum kahawae]
MKLHILRQKAARLNKGKKKSPKEKECLTVTQKEVRQTDMEAPVEQTDFRERPEAESPETQSSCSKLSTWNRNHIRNMRESRLLQLPEELLINIMRKAPPHELYILRQTCFTFFRLFQDVAFKAAHVVQEIQGRDVVCFNLDYQTSGATYGWLPLLRGLVTRLNLCDDCYRLKIKNTNLTVFQESYRYWRRLSHLERGACGCPDCDDCRRGDRRLQFSKRFETSDLCRRGAVSLCGHYFVSMTDIENQLVMGFRAPNDTSRFTFVECEKCVERCHSGVPAARGHRRTVPPSISTISRTFGFKIEWTLPIFTLGEERVTDTFLLDRLREFGKRHGKGLLCPHFDFRRLLQCFDPRICSCLGMDLRIGGSSSMASSRPGLGGAPRPTCNKASKLTPRDQFIPASWDNAMEQHSVSCEYCDAVYCWARDGCVVFLRRSSPATYDTEKKSCMEGVIRQIDPASYGVRWDPNSQNIIWCEDDSCRNGRDWAPVTKRLKARTTGRTRWLTWGRL